MRDHEARILAKGFRFLEAPKWHEGRLWMSDVFDFKLVSLTLDGASATVCDVPGRPGGQDFLPDGTHVVASAKDRKLLRIVDGRPRPYADLAEHATGDLNDFAVDARGRIYLGDFGYDYHGGEAPRPAQLYRIDPDGSVRVVAEDVHFPNGSVVIDEGRTLVVAETWKARIKAFDLSASGELSGPRIFADLGERQPDGICADRDGGVWAACFNTGEFLRAVEGGEITDRFRVDGSAISCALGGDDGRTLFMTCVIGEVEEGPHAPRNSAVFTGRVEVPGPASRGL